MSTEGRLQVPVTLLHLIIAAASVIILAWAPIAGYLVNGENRVTKVEEGQKYNTEKNVSQDRQLDAITTILSAMQISMAQMQIRLDGISTSVARVQTTVEGLSTSRFSR